MSGDKVSKKLKQNINIVHILTLMVAFHDGTIHDVATNVGDYNKTGGVPPAAASSRHWTYDASEWVEFNAPLDTI